MTRTPPTEAIDDNPTVCVQINKQWVSHVMGRLQALTQDWFWSGDETTIYDATQEAEKLMLSLAVGSEACMVPIGAIMAWPEGEAPDHWLLCHGTLLNVVDYPELYAVIGNRFGATIDGVNFRVPDLIGRFPLGATETIEPGTVGGAATVTLTTAQIPPHTHDILTRSSATAFGTATRLARPSGTGSADNLATESAGGSGTPAAAQPHDNMPPYLAMNYIIRAN